MGKEKKVKESRKSKSLSSNQDSHSKRELKAIKKAEKVAKALGYSNEINPFGDSNLLKPFTWRKKIEKDDSSFNPNVDSSEKRLSLIKDIERVRERRVLREKEMEEMERLRDEEMRLREAAQHGDWLNKEHEFHFEQTVQRCKLRIIENRRKPIDFLAQSIFLIESYESKEMVT